MKRKTEQRLDKILKEGGELSKVLSGYEYRAGQVEMAKACATAIEDRKVLCCHAPTGIGKSLAYLVGALAASETGPQTVVICTNTVNLQEQLMRKDLDIALQIFPKCNRSTIALLKGRRNFLCRFRLEEALALQMEVDSPEEWAELKALEEWSADVSRCTN